MAYPVITLLTDFGLTDPYVGVMKGVMLGINPCVKFVDITHEIEPGNIKQAAFRLFTAYKYFPNHTIHLVVVDPGVGSDRKPIIVERNDYYFVGPDNGVFSWIYAEERKKKGTKKMMDERVEKNFRVYEIDITQLIKRMTSDTRQWTISNTFHGRDIFAPTAAYLSLGVKASSLGKRIKKCVKWTPPIPTVVGNRHGSFLQGEVIDIDQFGNLITNICPAHTDCITNGGREFEIRIKNHIIREIKPYYEGNSPIAILGSAGFLELSLPNGNCAEFLKAKVGTKITLTFKEREKK